MKSLLSFHGLTGCDTVSAFGDKGKLKPLKVMIKRQEHINEFPETGDEPGISDEQLEIMQTFICYVHRHRVNLLRYKLYSSIQEKRLWFDCLQLHFRRAAYQSHIWRKWFCLPTPTGNGWELEEYAHGTYDSISIRWNNVDPALDKVLELMSCTCLRKCLRDACLCVDNSLPCTDACVKQECQNYIFRDSDINDTEFGNLSTDDGNC